MVDLPVWTVPPNWATPITERLAWLTDVMTTTSGREQRRGVRLSPRRSFEMRFTRKNEARSFLDRWLNTLASSEFLLPLWHDKAQIGIAAAKGSSNLRFDNTYREFETGGLAIVLRAWNDYEIVEIDSQSPTGLVTVTPLTKAWKVGAAVYPLRATRMEYDSNTLRSESPRVGQLTALFTLTGTNDYPDDYGGGLRPVNYVDTSIYEGLPVISVEPDRKERLELKFVRQAFENDAKIGQRYIVDEAERAFTTQMYNWQLRGREAHHLFRQMLYTLEGRKRGVQIPTFSVDVELTRPATAGENSIIISNVGFGYLGGPLPGRDTVRIGGNILRILSVGQPPSEDEEKLFLDRPLVANLAKGAVGSFIDSGRLDQDQVEITHYTDTDGLTEASAAIKTYKKKRPPLNPPVPRPSKIQYWFMGDRETFSDGYGTGVCRNGEKIGHWGNQGSRDPAINWHSEGKMTWHEGGLNGMPYIQGTPYTNFGQLFGMGQPGGIGGADEFMCAFVTDQVTGPSYLVSDQYYYNQGPNIRYLNTADERNPALGAGLKRVDFYRSEVMDGAVDYTQPQVVVIRLVSFFQLAFLLNDVMSYGGAAFNQGASGLPYTNFLHCPSHPSGGAFNGRLYEFMYWRDSYFTEAEMRAAAAYLRGKYDL